MKRQTGQGFELWLYAAAVAGECIGLGHALLPWRSAAAHAGAAMGGIVKRARGRALAGAASRALHRSTGMMAALLVAGMALASVMALGSPQPVAAAGWEVQAAPAGLPSDCDGLTGVWGVSASDVYAVTRCGVLIHYDGSRWVSQGRIPMESPDGVEPYISDIWGTSSDLLVLGGVNWHEHSVFRRSGGRWTQTNIDSHDGSYSSLWGASARNVFAVGGCDVGIINHYDGASWDPQLDPDEGTIYLHDVWGTSGSDVYAVGCGQSYDPGEDYTQYYSAILHFDGTGWTTAARVSDAGLSAIWGASAGNIFAVGSGGAILHYDASSNGYAERPVNISPANGEEGVSLTPDLQASAFQDPDGDTHIASRWQIRSTSGDYEHPVWDSGTASPGAGTTVPSGKLGPATTYYWRVGYRDSHRLWSSYSAETSFTTGGSAGRTQPVNVSPASGARDVNLTPTLKSSPFAGPDGDGHAASQWQVTGKAGSYAGALFDSGRDAVNLTQITLPSSILSPATRYCWRVRHLGSSGTWSEWSRETAFTTMDGAVLPPSVVTLPASNVNAGSARLNGELLSPGTASEVRVSFQWGTTASSYPNETDVEVKGSAGVFFADLGGLATGSTVYYRTRAVGDATVFGTELSLTTDDLVPTAPSVLTVAADGVAPGSARLRGDLTSLGTAGPVSVSFQWGYTRGGPYPNETAPAVRNEAGAFDITLTGLASGTTFYYQAKAVGHGTAYGAEKSFTTTAALPPTGPVITGLAVSGGRPGDSLTVSITGVGLGGATGVDFGPRVSVAGFTVVSGSEITVLITIDEGAEPGPRDVTVITPGGAAVAGGAFSVAEVGQTRLWVYLAAGLGGLVALGALASLAVWMLRRPNGARALAAR